jgi:hypothetical protein
MNTAKQKALEVIEKYGNNLQTILDAEGILLIDVPLAGRLKELYFGDVIVLRDDLSAFEINELSLTL